MDKKLFYIIFFLFAKFHIALLAEGECLLYADDASDYVERKLVDFKQQYDPNDYKHANIRRHFAYTRCFISFVREAFNPKTLDIFYDVSKWEYVKEENNDCKPLDVKVHLLEMIYLLMEANPTNGVLSIKESRMVPFGQLLNKMATKSFYVHNLHMTQEEAELKHRFRNQFRKFFNHNLKDTFSRNKQYGVLLKDVPYKWSTHSRYISMETTLTALMEEKDKDLAGNLSRSLSNLVFTNNESSNFRNNIGKVNMDLLILFLQQMVVVSAKGLLELKNLENFNASLQTTDDNGNDLRTLFDFVYAGNMRRKNDKENVTLTEADMSRKVFTLYLYWLIYKVDRSSRNPFMEKFMNRRIGERKEDANKPKTYLDPKNLYLNEIPKMTMAILILKAKNENIEDVEKTFINNIEKAYLGVHECQALCPDKIVPLEGKIEEFIRNGTITEETIEKAIAIDNASTMPTLFSGLTAMISGGTAMLNNAGKAATDIGKVSKALQYMINNPVSSALIPSLPISIPIGAIENINKTLDQMSKVEELSSYGEDIKNTLGKNILETVTTDKEKKVNISSFALLKAVVTLAPVLAGTLTPAGVPVAVASGLAKILIEQIQANDSLAAVLFNKSIGNLSETVQTVLSSYNDTSNNGAVNGAAGSSGPPPVPLKDTKNPVPVPPKDRNKQLSQTETNGPPPVPVKDDHASSRVHSKDINSPTK